MGLLSCPAPCGEIPYTCACEGKNTTPSGSRGAVVDSCVDRQ